jgi:hypothetical protein
MSRELTKSINRNGTGFTLGQKRILRALNDAATYATTKIIPDTTYILLEEDSGKVLIFTNAAAVAVTLPDALSQNWQATLVQTTALGVPTVTPSGSDTVNGAGTGVAPSAQWQAMYLVKHAAAAWVAVL